MGSFSFVGLPVLLAKARASVIQAVTESAEDLVGQAQDRTPVDTGTLRGSEHVASITTTATSATAKVATGGEANEYAIYVHEGTTKVAARPFMSQALLDNQAVYVEALRRAASGNF